ncbi:uncharacterized mitochondrial protein-like protein [Tanacetum coccineum]
MNEEKYTPPKSESNTDEDDVWYFDNGASNHMTGNYSYFSELNENITGRVRFGDGSCVSIKGKGSILLQGKNGEQRLLKNVYYILALRSNVISLGQATISGYDISIQVGRESDEEVNHHSSSVTVHETNPLVRLETIRLLIALATEKGWKIHKWKSVNLINEFKRIMASQFEMSNLGELTYYLGIEVSQGNDCVEIKKERYAMKILKESGMEDCITTLYPIKKDLKLSKVKDEPEVEATQYRKMVGCLRYLLHTRPDLAYSVSVVQLRLELNTSEVHHLLLGAHKIKLPWCYLRVKLSSWQPPQLRSRPVNKGLGAHKVQGDEIVTWCARVTLFDSEIQEVIVGEFLIMAYGVD